MAQNWGYDYVEVSKRLFNESSDKIFSFNSAKKRSTTVIHRADGTVTLYCKGASEWVTKDCVKFLDGKTGTAVALDSAKRDEIDKIITGMADRALRTLCLAHKEFKSASELPANWREVPPDNFDLILDCIVGIIDPLREDVKVAVATAQKAGVTVRMVTGNSFSF